MGKILDFVPNHMGVSMRFASHLGQLCTTNAGSALASGCVSLGPPHHIASNICSIVLKSFCASTGLVR